MRVGAISVAPEGAKLRPTMRQVGFGLPSGLRIALPLNEILLLFACPLAIEDGLYLVLEGAVAQDR